MSCTERAAQATRANARYVPVLWIRAYPVVGIAGMPHKAVGVGPRLGRSTSNAASRYLNCQKSPRSNPAFDYCLGEF
jgi:hypothetical protein